MCPPSLVNSCCFLRSWGSCWGRGHGHDVLGQMVGVGSSALSLCNAEVVGMKFGLVELVSLSFFLSLPVKGLPP